jgi:hypothetical protein
MLAKKETPEIDCAIARSADQQRRRAPAHRAR